MEIREIIRSAILLALLVVGAKVQIPLPYFDYYTFQFTFILLIGAILPMRYAAMTVSAYLLLGLAGLPIFASGGGIGYILKPSFGYLLGFALTSIVLAYITDKNEISTKRQYLMLNLLGMVITYVLGLTYKILIIGLYMKQTVPIWAILSSSFAFDIPADLLMIVGLSMVEGQIIKRIE